MKRKRPLSELISSEIPTNEPIGCNLEPPTKKLKSLPLSKWSKLADSRNKYTVSDCLGMAWGMFQFLYITSKIHHFKNTFVLLLIIAFCLKGGPGSCKQIKPYLIQIQEAQNQT